MAAVPGIRPPMRLLLHAMQSPINIGSVLRVAETFGVPVEIWDPTGLLDRVDARQTISDFSCGAFQRGSYRWLDVEPSAATAGGRIVATCLRERAVNLPDFRFRESDLVAVGNEYDGLPAGFVAAADERLHVPMPATFTPKLPSLSPIDPSHPPADPTDGSPVLSSAMSAGILCYVAYAQQLAGDAANAAR